MIANAAFRSAPEIKTKLSQMLTPKLTEFQFSNKNLDQINCMVESFLLLSFDSRNNDIIKFFSNTKQIDLHEFNPDSLDTILSFLLKHNCFQLPGTIIYGMASHGHSQENYMQVTLHEFLNQHNIPFTDSNTGSLKTTHHPKQLEPI